MVNSILDMGQTESSIDYRSKLTIPKNVNFGLEFELDKVDPNEVYHLVRSQIGENWKVKEEESLTKGESAEMVSPVLQNNKKTWVTLNKVAEILEKLNPNYDKCSFQINFDGVLLPTEYDRLCFLKLYAMYEDIIYRFSMGDDNKYRESLERYAAPIFSVLKYDVLALNYGFELYSAGVVIGRFSDNKNYGVIFKTKDCDLIEFRTPNMTNNLMLWQNYITTFYYLLKTSSSKKYNRKEVDKYIQGVHKMHLLEKYQQERREKALEFSEMIFSHNIDKINFMNQYLGEGTQKKYVLK